MKESDEENISNYQNKNLEIDKSNILVDSKNLSFDNLQNDIYKIKLITKQYNEVFILIKNEKSELSFICYYYKDYFKITFKNTFSLDKLKEQLNYYNQFSEIKEVFNEIYCNPKKGQEYLNGNENTEEKIKLIIPLPSKRYPLLEFQLNKEKKEQNDMLKEYEKVVNIYKNQVKIENFNSKILALREKDKEIIKSWISPIENFKAILLYSFYVSYKKIQYSYASNDNIYDKVYYEINKKDINKVGTVQLFHQKCDNKKQILVICKSRDQIFGGYTPLCFKSDDSYGKDNKSFLFSLNKKEKYPKNSLDENDSIWCYKDYGPSFHWDLYFRKNKMNTVKFEKKNYLTPSNWVGKNECYFDDFGIVLDSLEIFQIINITP